MTRSSSSINMSNKPRFPSNLNVFVIDIDLEVLEFIEKSCNKNSHQVKTCSESSSAVKLLVEKEIDFHLIIMELNMPLINGYEFLEFLDDEAIDVPLIITSEDHTLPTQEKALDMELAIIGLNPYLRINLDSLKEDEKGETCYDSDEETEAGNDSDEKAEAGDDSPHKKE
ncbi:hypothetical protein V8G54_003898 [Vigna mungo]|uniref:Response regulatory domain-containing protein n=1 Tax=Vigna mungo TaxID=3915 RepID=A0AAQ3SER6_VIGMU